MREIILDTETTGLNFHQGDQIIEVGCVELINHIPTGNNLQFYCSAKKTISPEAEKVHGLTNKFLSKHKTFAEQAPGLLNFIKEDTLIIHNADFDVGFINHELKEAGLEKIKNKVIDTVLLARKKLNTRIANLDYLCRRFSIDLSARKIHGAILDCQLLSEVYLELIGGKQTKLELHKNQQEVIKTKDKTTSISKEIHKITLTDKDIVSHKDLTKKIKNSLWEKLDY